MLKAESEEEESWSLADYAAGVTRKSMIVEHRQIDPSVIRRKAGAPHDHARLEHLIPADWRAAAIVGQTAHTRDAGVAQLAFGNADQGVAAAKNAGAHSLAESSVRG